MTEDGQIYILTNAAFKWCKDHMNGEMRVSDVVSLVELLLTVEPPAEFITWGLAVKETNEVAADGSGRFGSALEKEGEALVNLRRAVLRRFGIR